MFYSNITEVFQCFRAEYEVQTNAQSLSSGTFAPSVFTNSLEVSVAALTHQVFDTIRCSRSTDTIKWLTGDKLKKTGEQAPDGRIGFLEWCVYVAAGFFLFFSGEKELEMRLDEILQFRLDLSADGVFTARKDERCGAFLLC